ncbi:MAG: cupin, partial [Sphingomonadaceae bacterium]|nr:cupin [Sphingomonadaceae bacterium]
MTGARRLEEEFIHLGLGATAVPQPPFDGMEWYGSYSVRHGADGAEGRLVSQYTFTESWSSWEMHPAGPEVVICTGG